MTKSKISVSVVIPCYRCAETIRRAVASVMAQTQLPEELILVNDASDDQTMDILSKISKNYCKKITVHIITHEINLGVASARNSGWNFASSKFVAFLDSDDSWHPDKLKIQIKILENYTDLLVLGTKHLVCLEYVNDIQFQNSPTCDLIALNRLLWRNCFVTSSVILRKSLEPKFLNGQRHMEDHLLWLIYAANGVKMARVEIPLTVHHKYDYGAGGLSGQLLMMESAELRNYYYLHKSGKISLRSFLVLGIWSIAKFMRRVTVVLLRKSVSLIGTRY